MIIFRDLKEAAEVEKAGGQSMGLIGLYYQIYDGRPLQFNMALHRYPIIKFEERTPGKFTVAMAPEEGDSIKYTQAKVFTLDDPLDKMIEAFADNKFVRDVVDHLTGKPSD